MIIVLLRLVSRAIWIYLYSKAQVPPVVVRKMLRQSRNASQTL
jgi:hypothetical protein